MKIVQSYFHQTWKILFVCVYFKFLSIKSGLTTVEDQSMLASVLVFFMFQFSFVQFLWIKVVCTMDFYVSKLKRFNKNASNGQVNCNCKNCLFKLKCYNQIIFFCSCKQCVRGSRQPCVSVSHFCSWYSLNQLIVVIHANLLTSST